MDKLHEQLAEDVRLFLAYPGVREKVGTQICDKADADLAAFEAAKANGGDDALDLLQRRCDAYEKTLEDIRDDSGYNKESGLQAADVLRRWSALPPPPEQV
jgi:hypothetical protein